MHVCVREGCRGAVRVCASSSTVSVLSFYSRVAAPLATHFRNGPYRVRTERRRERKIYSVIMKIAGVYTLEERDRRCSRL